ncbi:MAG: hypothetical protein KDF59_05195, partial [Nitrosomonas sp.]|nr:hypothetical protein [Nitrosomonas sp.]
MLIVKHERAAGGISGTPSTVSEGYLVDSASLSIHQLLLKGHDSNDKIRINYDYGVCWDQYP